MSQRQTPIGYSIHDFLTRVIPGAVVIGPSLVVLILVINRGDLILTTRGILGIGFISFLIGESVVVLRSGERVPPPFLEEIYKSTKRKEALDIFMKTELWIARKIPKLGPSPRVDEEKETISGDLGFAFKENAEARLGVNFEETPPQDIYEYLLIFLEPGLSSQTSRRRSLYGFASNLQTAAVVSLFAYLFFALSSVLVRLIRWNMGDPKLYLIALLISVGVFIVNVVIGQLFFGISGMYVRSLLMEFRMRVRE